MKRVEVTWEDSAAVYGWKPRNETTAPVQCKSIGYVVERTKRKLVLAQSQNTDQLDGLFAIPTSAIRKVRKVR